MDETFVKEVEEQRKIKEVLDSIGSIRKKAEALLDKLAEDNYSAFLTPSVIRIHVGELLDGLDETAAALHYLFQDKESKIFKLLVGGEKRE